MMYEYYIVLQDGRFPFVAKPLKNKDGDIEGWIDGDGVAHPAYEDDLVKILSIYDFEQVEL